MTACAHTPNYPDPMSVPSIEECKSHCTVVEDVPEVAKQRALTSADGTTTRIDAAYWNRLNDVQKCCLIAHERGHPAIGMAVSCEGCADKMAGYYMRAWGYAPQTIKAGFASLNVRRDVGHGKIADNAAAGAAVAERAMAARGLLGLSSSQLQLKRANASTTTQKASTLHAPTKPTVTKSVTPAKPVSKVAATKSAPTPAPTPTTPSTTPQTAAARDAASSPAGDPILTSAPSLDPGGPATSGAAPTTTVKAPAQDVNASGTVNAPNGSVDAETVPADSDIAGDVVASVLGESARPHAVKVLIGAGIAATIAVVLVVVVRRAS